MNLPVALAPLVVVSLGLILFSLRDLHNRPDAGVRGSNRWVWLAVILFGNTLGSILYLSLGRQEPPVSDE